MSTPTEPTQAEIDAAAERLSLHRKYYRDGSPYENRNIILGDGCYGPTAFRESVDYRIVSDAYLAQRKAESASAERDARPITAECFWQHFGSLSFLQIGETDFELTQEEDGSVCIEGTEMGSVIPLPCVKTMGDLRELRRLLGCPLPESEGEA